MCENIKLLSKRQRRRKVTQSVKNVLTNINTENNNFNILHSFSFDECFNVGNNNTVDDDMVIDNVPECDNISTTSTENCNSSNVFEDYSFHSAKNGNSSENIDKSKDKNSDAYIFSKFEYFYQ